MCTAHVSPAYHSRRDCLIAFTTGHTTEFVNIALGCGGAGPFYPQTGTYLIRYALHRGKLSLCQALVMHEPIKHTTGMLFAGFNTVSKTTFGCTFLVFDENNKFKERFTWLRLRMRICLVVSYLLYFTEL